MRIAVGGILTECNHLGGLPIDMEVYESTELARGEEMLAATTSVVGGMLDVLREEQAEAVPLLFASACSGGPITTECYEALRDELFERLEAVLPVDGVLLPLHGAALADGNDDPEGEIIREVRQRVGPEVPIVVTVALHANITAEMVAQADAILAWETYPHYDQFQTGQRGARLLLDTTTRGGCGRLRSSRNSFCAGLDSTRYGVCRITSFCAPAISASSCGSVTCCPASGASAFSRRCLRGRSAT